MHCLAACAADHLAAKHPAELSPGELRRVPWPAGWPDHGGATVLLLDEPTAHLDRASADAVSRSIDGLRGKATVLLVAHDRQTRELADRLVAVGARSGTAATATASPPPAAPTLGSRVGRRPRCGGRPQRG